MTGVGLTVVGTVAGMTIWDKISHLTKDAKQTNARLSCLEACCSNDDVYDYLRNVRQFVSLLFLEVYWLLLGNHVQ